MFALIYGIMPYRGAKVREIKDKVLNDDYKVNYKVMNTDPVSSECTKLIQWMLERNPKRRPTVNEILAHDWLQNVPERHTESVFNESERVKIIKEYLYAEDEEKWSSFVNLTVEEIRRFAPTQFKDKLNHEEFEANVSDGSDCSLVFSPNISFQDSDKAKEPFDFGKG